MEKPCEVSWANVTADSTITRSPAYLCCVALSVGTNGDYVEIYEGRDASSGRKILKIKALANRSQAFNFRSPVRCDRGIFVAFSTTGSECTITFRPLEHETELP